jgi:hypothetical protein
MVKAILPLLSGGLMVFSKAKARGGACRPLLIRGARALAVYVFGDEGEWRAIYPLKAALGLIKMGGQLAGRPETMERYIAAHERASRRSYLPVVKGRRGRPRKADRAGAGA